MNDAKDSLAAGLATPLSSVVLVLPSRLVYVLEGRGVETVADLVSLDPKQLLAERNLGQKSIRQAHVAIRALLGIRWEHARALLARRLDPAAASSLPPDAERWQWLAARFAEVGRTPLDAIEFTARLRTFARSRGITTVNELLAVPWEDFSTTERVGWRTISAAVNTLEAAVERLMRPPSEPDDAIDAAGPTPGPPIAGGARWAKLLRRSVARLEGHDRIIATARSGLAGPIPTLAELGERIGLSRERVRQIEVRAIERLRRDLPCAELTRRLAAGCEESLLEPLDAVATRDSLFTVDPEELAGFRFLVNDVLHGETRVRRLGERWTLARVDESTLLEYLRRAVALLEDAIFPAEESEMTRKIAIALDVAPVAARSLLACLESRVLRDGTRLVGFGRLREDVILATLRAATGPVARSTIIAEHGRGPMPEEAIFVRRGLVSLAEKIDGWDRWAKRLPPLVRSLIERRGPERQWSTEELLEFLALERELPDWMNATALGSLLRRSKELAYLGQNVVALPTTSDAGGTSEAAKSKRIQVVPTLEEILRAHGRPMREDEARSALAKVRGLSSYTWGAVRTRPPFVPLDAGMIGLFPRDVAGGKRRAAHVLGALHASLLKEQHGLTETAAARFLEGLGARAEGYTPRVLRGVARLDGRFRLSVSGTIGLAAWEPARVARQGAVLEELLREAGGSVAVDVARARILRSSGESIRRSQLVRLAASIGALLAGDSVVRRTEGPDLAPVSGAAGVLRKP